MSLLEDYPEQNFLVQAYSRGSAVFDTLSYDLTTEQAKRLTVHTFGATRLARNDRGFREAINFAHERDPITLPERVYYAALKGVNQTWAQASGKIGTGTRNPGVSER